jgi:hypothetical protein
VGCTTILGISGMHTELKQCFLTTFLYWIYLLLDVANGDTKCTEQSKRTVSRKIEKLKLSFLFFYLLPVLIDIQKIIRDLLCNFCILLSCCFPISYADKRETKFQWTQPQAI